MNGTLVHYPKPYKGQGIGKGTTKVYRDWRLGPKTGGLQTADFLTLF
jgi:hypothetical protein